MNNVWDYIPSAPLFSRFPSSKRLLTFHNSVPEELTLKNNLFQKCTVIIYSLRFCMISFCCVQWNHLTNNNNKKKADDIFFLLFELWKLGTHHWVFTIALWLRLAGGWLMPTLCGASPGRFTVVAEQSLYKQTKWMICKLAHEKSDRARAHTQTRTYLHLGQYSHTLIVQSGCLHKRKKRWGNSMTSSLGAASSVTVRSYLSRKEGGGGGGILLVSYHNHTAEPAAVLTCKSSWWQFWDFTSHVGFQCISVEWDSRVFMWSSKKVKYEIWFLFVFFVCKRIPRPHGAEQCQSLGAPSTVHSQLVPEIINMRFSIKASSIQCNTLTERLQHFNRYTLESYICRILQAHRSRWHLTHYGQMLSDFFYACVYYRPEKCFFFPLKSMIVSSMSFQNSHGQHVKMSSIWHEFYLYAGMFPFYIQSKQIAVVQLPQYGSIILSLCLH